MERLSRLYPDPVLLFSVILLFLIGFLSILSVKVMPHLFSDLSLHHFRRPFFFLISFLVGLFVMSFMSYALNYKKINNRKVVYFLVGVSLTLLFVVFLKKLLLGKPVERWLLGTSVQPSEFSKIVVVLFVAYYVARKGAIDRLRFFGWAIFVVVAHSILLFLQPDKGMALFIFVIAWGMLWMGGTSPRIYVPVGGLFVLIGGFMLFFGGDYVHRRFLAWHNPIEDSFGTGYQVIQSLLAFMNGGFLGQGFGKGFQKLGPLTQADTDYILAVIGEEMGLPGLLMVFLLYGVLVKRLILIAGEVADVFGKLIVYGVVLNLVLSVVVNVMMTVNLLPPKGIPLPFVSYGVSNMLANLLALGLVGAVYKRQLHYRLL
ncbi:FtsW/RodA/SpoVE family cell cycle protein [Hydrogenivirga sp. 128-5-R1-1]|uniref:FtsW/RodA/SpoVE family cell cycle protein n=1 Tax=Hydrogenivirga sp. 128-5-R1-1 TaxID=392423 RepID=UPI00015EF807|nr:FtsW/RodA/SpoVE family cell cycle protein [Hydrogenivirga sp. 128-5-R1-1]EDP74952.1 cell division protein FtsW [Hydrogenivirga sp. 128-5-R1-1]